MEKSLLILKSFLGLAFLIFVMSLALFGPYQNLHYRLAWIYLLVFTVAVLCITVYLFLFDKQLLIKRLAAGPVSEQRTAQKIIQSLLFTPMALGSWYGLIPVLLLIIVVAYRAIDEEKVLSQNLPGYKAYCEKVRYRLIPFIF